MLQMFHQVFAKSFFDKMLKMFMTETYQKCEQRVYFFYNYYFIVIRISNHVRCESFCLEDVINKENAFGGQ